MKMKGGMAMPKRDKYIGITNYLKNSDLTNLLLSFKNIEELIEDSLPASAYKHRAFWSNTETYSVAFGWLNAGYKTVEVNFERQKVVFEKEQE